MTHAQAALANKVHQNQSVLIDGERCPVVWSNEEGCVFVDRRGFELFVYWAEIEHA
jgi:hypothetical protein